MTGLGRVGSVTAWTALCREVDLGSSDSRSHASESVDVGLLATRVLNGAVPLRRWLLMGFPLSPDRPVSQLAVLVVSGNTAALLVDPDSAEQLC
jgi:hypothetical protein